MTRTLTLLLAATLAACGSPQSEAPAPQVAATPAPKISEAAANALAEYETIGRQFIADLANGADAAALSEQARKMMELGASAVPAYVEILPECADYLEAASQIVTLWESLSPEQIEHDYHEDGALPKMPRSECYHMKDVVVHPATALALLAQPEPDREQVHNEIFEVVTHAMAVRTGVGFNSADGD